MAAAIVLTIGILNYDEIKSKLESQIAGGHTNSSLTPEQTNKVPKTFEYGGRNIDMEKVVAELGDRKAAFAAMLADWRDTIDKGGDLTSALSPKQAELNKLFPELLGRENARIYSDGFLYNTDKSRGVEVKPPQGWNDEKQAKYEQLSKSELRAFIYYLSEMRDNAGMFSSGDRRNDPKYQQRIKEIRDTFDMYAKYFATDGWKNTSINYNQISLVDNGDEIDVKKDKLTRLIENSGLQIDRLISVINTVDGQRRAFVTVGIKNGPIDTVKAKEIHAKIKEELAEKNINGLKLTILFNVEANTYSVNVWDFSGNIEVSNYFTGER